MSRLFQLIVIVLLAGCATSPQQHKKGKLPPNWESETVTNKVAPVFTNAPAPHPIATNRIVETWIPLERWSKENGLPAFKQISADPVPTYALTAREGVMVIRANSRSAWWNGLEVQLGMGPQMIDGQPFIHGLDGGKVLLPLLRPAFELSKTNRVIVIDPGHGGVDNGAKNISTGGHEKEFTLDWALRLQTLLATNGWKVFLTRTNDANVSLSERVAFAERAHAGIFVSLHFNAARPGTQAGLETYCLTPRGLPSNLTREFSDDSTATFPNNAFDLQNLQLAVRLHRALLQVDGKMDRGVRHARFMTVLRGQNRPAVLIEGGYLSNRDEALLIAESDYRQKLAEAVAKALE